MKDATKEDMESNMKLVKDTMPALDEFFKGCEKNIIAVRDESDKKILLITVKFESKQVGKVEVPLSLFFNGQSGKYTFEMVEYLPTPMVMKNFTEEFYTIVFKKNYDGFQV